MDLAAAFTGTLLLPDKEFLNSRTAVTLADGQTVAYVQWSSWSQRFSVLDAKGTALAQCVTEGFFRRRYVVTHARAGRTLVDFKPGAFRAFNGGELAVGGRPMRVRQVSMWSERRFEFYAGERLVARIEPTTGVLTFRPDSYAFEVAQPVMSGLEAICLAQTVRTVVRSLRRARASSS